MQRVNTTEASLLPLLSAARVLQHAAMGAYDTARFHSSMQTLAALYDQVAHHSLKLQGYRSRFVQASTGRVHLLEARGQGSAPPLVMLHGFSSCGAHFHPIARKVRAGVRRLILPDLPAHGLSDTPRVPTARGVERGLIEALDAVIDEPSVIFGLSMGGLAAIRYALASPQRVKGLVLCSPGGAEMADEELERLTDSFCLESHASALAFVDRLLTKPSILRQAYAFGVRRSFGRPAMRTLLASMKSEDLLRREHLAKLDVPLLLLWGRRDRILPPSSLEFFRSSLPAHARIEEPESFGHSPFLEQPDELATRIEGFLDSLVTRPSIASREPGERAPESLRRAA
jgi:pimeloyl-ACP methyl ester carboxylesterase